VRRRSSRHAAACDRSLGAGTGARRSLAYGFDFLADQPVPPQGRPWSYVVRQVGWMYALAEYYGWSGDARLRAPAVRALNGLRAHSVPLGKARVQDWIESTRILSLPVRALEAHQGARPHRLALPHRRARQGREPRRTLRHRAIGRGRRGVARRARVFARVGDESFADLRPPGSKA
jgi:hypothetical protein